MSASVDVNPSSPCTGEQTLVEFLTGRLTGARLARVEEHLDACQTCRRLVAVARLASPAPALESTVGVSRAVLEAADASAVLTSLRTVDDDEYRIERELARGGMGRILLATDRQGRRVAIKVLLDTGAASIWRFVRELQLTGRLQHPSIVTLHEAGRWRSGEPFFTMKLVEGQPLSEALQAASSLQARLELLPRLIAATDALAYAHHHGVIHRDLKPANVLLGAFGETVVIDWGLATRRGSSDPEPDDSGERNALGATNGLTLAGTALGTPAYMPPEQARGLAVSERADVYGLGAILYHLLCGQPPYVGASAREVLQSVLAGSPTPLEARAPALPADLAAIVHRAMQPDPDDRYPTAKEMADDIRRFAAGQLVSAYSYPLGTLLRRWMRRYRAVLSLGAALLVLGVLGGFSSVARIIDERQRADEQRSLATAHRAAAEDLVSFLLAQFRDRVRRADRLDLFEGLGKEVEQYYSAIDSAEPRRDEGSLASRARVLETLGSVELDRKNLDDARRFFERALELLARSAAEGTTAAQRAASQAWIWQEIATIEDARGDLAASLAARQRAVDLAEGAARLGADRKEATLLAVSNLGERAETLYYIQGDAEAALAAIDRARQLLEPLLVEHPDDAAVAWKLALLNRLACDPEQSMGRLDAATSSIERSLALYERVLREQPGNGVARREHAYALGFVSTTAAAAGRLAAALAAMRSHLDLYEKIAAEDPSNQATREDLAWGYATDCSLQRSALRLEAAETSCQRAVSIFRDQVAHDRDSKTTGHALSNALVELGRLRLSERRPREAQQLLLEALSLCRQLSSSDPETGLWQLGVVTSLTFLAQVELTLGADRDAVLHGDEAIRLAELGMKDRPGADAEGRLARLRILAGDAARAEGRQADALASYRVAHDALEALNRRAPGFATYRVDLAEAGLKLARATDAGDPVAARSWRKRSLEILNDLHRAGRLSPESEPLRSAATRELEGLAPVTASWE